MSKRLTVVLALALIVGLTFGAAYAEVQNVKVSGDIVFSGVARNDFNLVKQSKSIDEASEDKESMFLSQTRVRVDADLTDNVAATVRLINERNWDTETIQSTDIDLDLAFVTLKEFLYSPLNLTIGRQEIRFGNGLIIGNARSYNTAVLNGVPSDLSSRKAFDALRATLNYDPLIIDLIYSKIDESNDKANNDIDLYGINAAYDINKNLKAEGYIFTRKDHGNPATTPAGARSTIHTIGALLTATPIDNLKTSLEAAIQLGKTEGGAAAGEKQRAFALQAMGDYTFADKKYTPAIGATYTYLSGDRSTVDPKNRGWNRMFYDQALNNITYAILPFSNMQVINLRGSVKPTEDTSVMLNYGYYRKLRDAGTLTSVNVDGAAAAYTYTLTDDDELGSALDLTGIYDYTEDVQFGLTVGMFVPGKGFAENNRRTASQAIGSMKVVF